MFGSRSRPIPWSRVRLLRGYLDARRAAVIETTLPVIEQKCKESGAWDAWQMKWKSDMDISDGEGRPAPGVFLESDVTKWIEAAAYSLISHPDPKLEARIDEAVSMIAAAQQQDGYVNVHFTCVRPQLRFMDLRTAHELYCAGHLFEAAVAHHQATGKKSLLHVACRYADLLVSKFGTNEGQTPGVCGHPEVELALMRLAEATGEERYAHLAACFVRQRGQDPNFFLLERENPAYPWNRWWDPPLDYYQAHAPVAQQRTAEGHAVRAVYLYAGVADVVARTDDPQLREALLGLWKNVVEHRMYVTGGIGSTNHGERFTVDYDLPNDVGYAETCAAVGMVFWAQRMLAVAAQSEYGDVLELALFNGALVGISLDGRKFSYANYLDVRPGWHVTRKLHPGHRQPWFHCACCPPNIARLLTSISGFIYARSEDGVRVDLYAASETEWTIGEARVQLRQETDYPWSGAVRISVRTSSPVAFAMGLRLPGWCRAPALSIDGEAVDLPAVTEKGYAWIHRVWNNEVVLELEMPMTAERLHANPAVAASAGKVAIRRGPTIYCMESADQPAPLSAFALAKDATFQEKRNADLGGAVTLETSGVALSSPHLYSNQPPAVRAITLRFVPYALWGNRGDAEMQVWVNQHYDPANA